MKNSTLFLILSLIQISFIILTKIFFRTDELLIQSLAQNITKEQINNILNYQQKFEWLSYILIVFILFIKMLLISTFLYLGVFLLELNVEFKKVLKISIKSEFIFIGLFLFKIIWLNLFTENYDLKDVQYFLPFSALNIIGYENLDPWWIYPLQVLNLFELAYWLILAYLLGKELKVPFEKGLKIVASSYGPALLIWVVAVMFFTLNNS